MTYIDPDLRELFELAKEHEAVFIWDAEEPEAEIFSVDMDRLMSAVGEEELAQFNRLLGGSMIRLPVVSRNFWAPTGSYEGYKGDAER